MLGVHQDPALVGEATPGIGDRLMALEAKRPIDLDDVAGIASRIRRRSDVAAHLHRPLRYSHRVEASVSGLGIEHLLPHARRTDDAIGRFLRVWEPDELRHAAALELVMDPLGIAPSPTRRADDAVPIHNRLLGTLGRHLPKAYEILALTVHTVGAITERLALGAYTRMRSIAQALDEPELASGIFTVLRRDESLHLAYYRTYAKELRARTDPWQHRLVRSALIRTYSPVGAGSPQDKAELGRVMRALEVHDRRCDDARAADRIAAQLLSEPGQPIPSFVTHAIESSLQRTTEGPPPPRLRQPARYATDSRDAS